MIGSIRCDKCIHNKVCGKKEKYLEAYKFIAETTNALSAQGIDFDKDFVVDIICNHLLI